MKITFPKNLTFAIAGFFLATNAVAQQELPAPLAKGAESEVPVAVQILRWKMLDGDVNALTFRHMDELFTTRKVARSGTAWSLPRRDHDMDFDYTVDDTTYAADDILERNYTNALLIIKDGAIVVERYLNNADETSTFMGWSMTKSITSLLVGKAIEEGLIESIDDPVVKYLPELGDGAYRDVSIRQILEMRSGVDYEERYDFENPGIAATNHIDALVKNVARFADAARAIEPLHKPGAVFQYKTIDTAVLGWLIERVAGSSVAAYTAQSIWEPLGAEADGYYILDGAPGVGREFSGAGFNATLRDWGRLGLMMLNTGQANGRSVVPGVWVRQSTGPATEEGNYGGYGYQWWTLPDSDAYMAVGLQGQFVFVDTGTQTVIAKMSYFPPGNEAPSEEAAAFFRAASQWNPK